MADVASRRSSSSTPELRSYRLTEGRCEARNRVPGTLPKLHQEWMDFFFEDFDGFCVVIM